MLFTEWFKRVEPSLKMKVRQAVARADSEGWEATASHWRVSITSDGEIRREFGYSMGSAYTGEPKLIDVIYSIVSDSSGLGETFKEWCDTYDYDTDSRRANKIYKACLKNAGKLAELLGDKDYIKALNCEMDY